MSTQKTKSQNEQNTPTISFNYEGQNISFQSQDGTVAVNATQMAKKFNKRPKEWTRLKASKEFLNALKISQRANQPFELFNEDIKLIKVVKGGKNPGTWMHEDVAIEFARWLNPLFAIWTNKHIKELLLKGITSINQSVKGFPELPPKRNHNRLTDKRKVDIMITVCKIGSEDVRMELLKKLGI